LARCANYGKLIGEVTEHAFTGSLVEFARYPKELILQVVVEVPQRIKVLLRNLKAAGLQVAAVEALQLDPDQLAGRLSILQSLTPIEK